MASRIADCRLFFQEFRRNFHTTGAILPSGRRVSHALTHFVRSRKRNAPRRILEVGPGTGAVTEHIIRQMHPEDCLDLVEINESFVERLNDRFRDDPVFQAVADRSKVHCTRIENLPSDSRYDVIISGLPLNNFAVNDVEQIVGVLRGLTGEGTTLSFFEYIAIRHLKATVSGSNERARLRGVGEIVGNLLKLHEIRRDWVWSNVPPAWVHHLQF